MGDWKGEAGKREDLTSSDGDVSMSRTDVAGDKRITISLIKYSPLNQALLPLLANEEMLKVTHRKSPSVLGEIAVMMGDSKLQLVADGRILIEFVVEFGPVEIDLVALAGKRDWAAIRQDPAWLELSHEANPKRRTTRAPHHYVHLQLQAALQSSWEERF